MLTSLIANAGAQQPAANGPRPINGGYMPTVFRLNNHRALTDVARCIAGVLREIKQIQGKPPIGQLTKVSNEFWNFPVLFTHLAGRLYGMSIGQFGLAPEDLEVGIIQVSAFDGINSQRRNSANAVLLCLGESEGLPRPTDVGVVLNDEPQWVQAGDVIDLVNGERCPLRIKRGGEAFFLIVKSSARAETAPAERVVADAEVPAAAIIRAD